MYVPIYSTEVSPLLPSQGRNDT